MRYGRFKFWRDICDFHCGGSVIWSEVDSTNRSRVGAGHQKDEGSGGGHQARNHEGNRR